MNAPVASDYHSGADSPPGNTQAWQAFDPNQVALLSDICLLEASAGTGKTYSIASLALRMIVEQGIAIDRILMVTFTEAAAAELRERVRLRLQAAESAARGGMLPDASLEAIWTANPQQQHVYTDRLSTALLNFDLAPVFTLHGFCNRLLSELAFENGALFNVELLLDDKTWVNEAINDFIRIRIYDTTHPANALYAANVKQWVKLFSDLAKRRSVFRSAPMHPKIVALGADAGAAQFQTLVNQLRTAWQTEGDQITALWLDSKQFNKDVRQTAESEWIPQLQAAFGEQPAKDSAFLMSSALSSMTREFLVSQLSKRSGDMARVDQFSLFSIWFQLQQLIAESWRPLQVQLFLDYLDTQLAERARQTASITFDAMIEQVFAAVEGPAGPALVTEARCRYKAALIDEFQDTDPRQWTIFYRLFGEDCQTFLIGDPKQAIYTFRGADVFAYLVAAGQAHRRYSLAVNWRSDAPLVAAVQSLFMLRRDAPFVVSDIGLPPVTAHHAGGEHRWSWPDCPQPAPLQFIRAVSLRTNVETAFTDNVRHLQREMLSLLNAGVQVAGRPLRPGDIAVLVQTNKDADQVKSALAAIGIPAVLRTRTSVFQTDQARWLSALLALWLEPQREDYLRAVLAMPLFGYSTDQLAAADEDSEAWLSLSRIHTECHTLWRQEGFYSAFRTCMFRCGVAARIVRRSMGEREITNLLHLGELLHDEASARDLSPADLYTWFRDQVGTDDQSADRSLLRMESDDDAVQIVTIHRSKGLQYPVVFLPSHFAAKSTDKKPVVEFHDGNLALNYSIDPASLDPSLAQQVGDEAMSELLRLLYVGLTRACHRCYLYQTYKSKQGSVSTAVHYLTGGLADDELAAALNPAHCQLRDIDDDQLPVSRWQPVAPTSRALDARPLPTIAPWRRLRTSFSLFAKASVVSATAEHGAADDVAVIPDDRTLAADPGEADIPPTPATAMQQPAVAPAADEPAAAADPLSDPAIDRFPAGAHVGQLLHHLLETRPFTQAVADWQRDFASACPRFGVEARHAARGAEMLYQSLNTELPASAAGFRLCDLPPAACRAEVPFELRIRHVSGARLAACLRDCNDPAFSRHFIDRLAELTPPAVDGFLTGFIDLLLCHNDRYFIVDWKSNALPAGYSASAIGESMDHHFYPLQSLFYQVALNTWLPKRVAGYSPDIHWGGALYVYLRGTDTRYPGAGVMHHAPTPATIARVGGLLIPS
jgi:exodeoxyribonuclease V beta subunit